MTITASVGQQAAMQTQIGRMSLALVGGSQPANVLSTAPTAGPVIPVTGQRLTVSVAPFGTLANDASVTLLGEINGSSYFPIFYAGTTTVASWTGTQINNAVAGAATGLLATIDTVKVNSIKFVLSNGTTTVSASNGVTTRVMD
jgi:hypothetical protein